MYTLHPFNTVLCYYALVVVQSIVINLTVCVSVCLSVREHISGTAGLIRMKFCEQIPWPWLGPAPAALHYVVYFRFDV